MIHGEVPLITSHHVSAVHVFLTVCAVLCKEASMLETMSNDSW